MDTQSFFLDLAVIQTGVGAVSALCARFKLPKVIACILVGVLLGPHTFGMSQPLAAGNRFAGEGRRLRDRH